MSRFAARSAVTEAAGSAHRPAVETHPAAGAPPDGWLRRILPRALAGRFGSDAKLPGILGGASMTLASKILGAGGGFAFNVMLARQLGADEYGLFSFVLSLVAILSIAAALGMNQAAVAFIARYAIEQRWDLLYGVVRWGLSRVFLLSLAVAGCLVLVAVLPVFAISAAERQCLLVGSGIVVFGALAIAQAGMLRGLRHLVIAELAESGGFRSVFSALSLLGVLLLGYHVATAEQGLWIATICAAVALLISSITLYRRLPGPARASRPDYRSREWLRIALPFALITSAFMVQSQVDIFMVRCFVPLREVGIFSAATRIALLVGFGVVSMSAVMSPIIAEMFALGRRAELQKLIYQTSAMTSLAAALVCVAGGIWGHSVLGMFGPEFVDGYTTLLILLCSQCLNALAGNAVFLMSMTGHQFVAARAVLIAVACNVALNAVLIPRFGIEGAAWGSFAATLLWRTLINRHLAVHAQLHASALMPVLAYLKRRLLPVRKAQG